MLKTLPGVLSGLTGLLLGIGAYTFHFAEGLSYFSNDPNACANCHIMREYRDSWQKSSHHTRAVCNDCHSPHALLEAHDQAYNGWNHSVKFTLSTFADPIRIRPVNAARVRENCVHCHQELLDDVRRLPAHSASHDIDCAATRESGTGRGDRP